MYSITRKSESINSGIVWRDDQIEHIIHLYNNKGLSPPKISKLFNVSSETIRLALTSNDVELNAAGHYNRVYERDSSYFKYIDSEDKAYWLGFLYADGYIVEDRYKLRINLSDVDRNHLLKFNKAIKTDRPLFSSNKKTDKRIYKITSLEVSDKEMISDLIDKGCRQNKTKRLEFPNEEILPNHLVTHFIRGYFDGDGSIHINRTNIKSGHKYFRISFYGTNSMLSTIQKHLECEDLKLEDKGGHSVLAINGNRQCLRILNNIIYKNANTYLDRKYEKYLELKEHYA